MYNEHFGFREKPFKLVPSPDFLFMGRGHSEALAHLTYAVSEGDGFVLITGEVGTGKSTLCRVFLEKIDPTVETAYIFNPKLNALELLKSINAEFGIPTTGKTATDLIQTLNQFLVIESKAGHKAVLIIDEAQHLTPDALEQIRMLSNLETTQHKLLQIILVGQPELEQILDSFLLRPLRQRITLNCHLQPLTPAETRNYIQHRISVAAVVSYPMFTPAAIRAVRRYSRGIPRLINIACDRALLAAYVQKVHKVNGRTARTAIMELSAKKGNFKRFHFSQVQVLTIICALSLGIFIAALFFNKNIQQPTLRDNPPDQVQSLTKDDLTLEPLKTFKVPKTQNTIAKTTTQHSQQNNDKTPQQQALAAVLAQTNPLQSRRQALTAMLTHWQVPHHYLDPLENISDDDAYFSTAVMQHGLMIQRIDQDLNLVKKLNLPAIFAFTPPGAARPRYLALNRIQDSKFIFGNHLQITIPIDATAVPLLYNGTVYVPWKNFMTYYGTIPDGAPHASVVTLKMLLKDLGYENLTINGKYDTATVQAVKEIQARHGLKIDGRVGPFTKIAIYNEKKSLPIPHLRE